MKTPNGSESQIFKNQNWPTPRVEWKGKAAEKAEEEDFYINTKKCRNAEGRYVVSFTGFTGFTGVRGRYLQRFMQCLQ